MATSSVMLGSSSTTRTRAPSLLTIVMLPRLSVNLLRNEWELARQRPSRDPMYRPLAVDQPGRNVMGPEPPDGFEAFDDYGGRGNVGVDARTCDHRRRPPRALAGEPRRGVD